MGSRRTVDGVEKVYAAAAKWVDRALRKDGSLFSPGSSIWSRQWLEDLRQRFLDQPEVPGNGFYDKLSRAAAKHTTVAERKCTTGVMPEGADLGVGVATGTVVGGRWEDYGPACSGAEDSVAFCRLPLRR